MKLPALHHPVAGFLRGILNSYAQVFFSQNRLLGGIIFLITFFNVEVGVCGLLAVLISQCICYFLFQEKMLIKSGLHSYNSLMVGLAIGTFYALNWSIVVLTIIASLLTFLFSEWMIKSSRESGLPFLSVPFLLVVWIVLLGADNFSALQLNVKQVQTINMLFPTLLEKVTELIALLPFSNLLYLYFRSLGAVIFQYNDLAGILVSIAILYHSRISFLLSVVGFSIGYLFYHFFEGDFSELIYSYIGFNFILTAIAIGGFFVIPSKRSFALLIISIPIIALLISALTDFFTFLQLPFYSLPYNIVVLLILSALKTHGLTSKLNLTVYQSYSPEINLANFTNLRDRFQDQTKQIVVLPFLGKWRVSQGYEGKITHLGAWSSALDFDIVKEGTSTTYKNKGVNLTDYYCYNLPVLAPAEGHVVDIVDGIPDNSIGEVDLNNNWGNSIVIQHDDGVYSQLSHLKAGSFQVKVGDFVKQQQVLARCGSSGRSPEPHIHFQFQLQAHVGAPTIEFPISYFMKEEEGGSSWNSFKIPEENEIISNGMVNREIVKAFDFKPGSKMELLSKSGKETIEVFSDQYNKLYFKSHEGNSYAYFVNNGIEFYFTSFEGDHQSLLYILYLSVYRVSFCQLKDEVIEDKMMSNQFLKFPLSWLEDFLSPFHRLSKTYFKQEYITSNSLFLESQIKIKSEGETHVLGKKQENYESIVSVESGRLIRIDFKTANHNKTILCEPKHS